MASSTSTSKKASREGRNRRIWNPIEEKALIDSYYLIIADGYKLDNGQYRPGYLLELEKNLIKILPNTDLRERPHIESKIKIWRKQRGSIFTALATSGIAWNDSQKMLTIEDEDVWTQICKRDPKLCKLRNKPVEWYDDWQRIFGKDKATGEHAEVPADILENLDKEQCDTEFSCSTGDLHANEGRRKKAKFNDALLASMEKMQDNVQSLLKITVEQFEVMTQRMGYEHDLAKNRRDVYGIINNIGIFTSRDKLIAVSKIVEKSADVDLFLNLPEEMGEEYVTMKLEEQDGNE